VICGYHPPAMNKVIQLSIPAVLAGVMSAAGGCANKLETGYVPRKLGASTEARRGYYAQPFSPEAQKAKQYQQDFGPVNARSKSGD
jgi:hypothetical protein